MKQRGDKEGVVWKLNSPRLPLDSFGAHPQPGGHELLLIILVHAVVAEVLLGVVFITTDFVEQSAGENLQTFVTRSFKAALAPVGQSAGERSDDVMR